MAGRTEYELAVKIIGLMDNSFGQSMNLTKTQIKKLAKTAAASVGDTVTFQQSMEKAGPAIDKAWNGVTRAAKVGAAAIAAAGAAAIAAGKAAVDTGSEFEKAMSSWKATASATDAEYREARDAAMEWGRSTTKTASESANALEYMALAGWSVKDSIAALPGVLRLSEATNLDLARTSDLVTDSMAATGEQIGENGKELERFLDIAAQANNSSNQTAEQLMEAWIKTGGILSNLNVDISESATALGILANRGIKAEEAGTKFKAIMTNLTTGSGEAGKMIAKLGVNAFDSKGKFVGLRNLLEQVNEKTKNLTEEERNAAFAALGGKRHVDGLNDLMQGLNNLTKEGVSEWEALEKKLTNASGALEKMANTKMDNLWGDMKILHSAMDDVKIRIYEGMRVPLRDAAKEMTGLIYGAGDLADKLQYSYPTLKRNLKELTESAGGLMNVLGGAAGFAINNPQAVLSPAAGAVASIATLKGIRSANDALFGKKGLITAIRAISASGGGKILLGITVAAGAIAAIKTAKDIYDFQQKEKSLLAHFGTMQLNSEELDKLSERILGEEGIRQAEELEQQMEKIRKGSSRLEEANQTYQKLSWKVKLGVELSEEEKEEMKRAIDSMVQLVNQYVEDKQYAVHLSTQFLFGDSPVGTDIEEGVNDAFSAIQGELTEQSKLLGDAMAAALEDGMIDLDEQKLIDSYVGSIAKIRQRIEESEQEAKFQRIEREYGSALTKDSYENLKEKLNSQAKEANLTIDQGTETTLQGLRLSLETGKLSNEEYNEAVKKTVLAGEYRKSTNNSRAAIFNTSSISAAYGKEESEAARRINEGFRNEIEEMYAGLEYAKTSPAFAKSMMDPEYFKKVFGLNKIPKATKDAIKEIWDREGFENLLADREKLHAAGYEIGEEMQQGIHDSAVQGAMAGNRYAIWELMREETKNNPKYRKILQEIKNQGFELPKTLGEAIIENSGETLKSIDQLVGLLNGYIHTAFSEPFYTSGRVRVQWQTENTFSSSVSPNRMSNEEYSVWRRELDQGKIRKHAKGGVVDSPELSWIGEGGDREYVIPINRSPRSMALLEAAQRDLQTVGAGTGRGSSEYIFSPQIIVQGNADREIITEVMHDSERSFRESMEAYERERFRIGYGQGRG